MPIAEGSTAAEAGVQQGDVSTLDMASLLLCAYELGDWIMYIGRRLWLRMKQ
jgi:hypothetical protein